MLHRLHVKGFKSLHDNTIELAPLVVLFGPNATGKSNVLESIWLLARLVTERTVADAFEGMLRGLPLEGFTLPREGLPGLLKQERATLTLEGDVSTPSEDRPTYRYRAAVRITPRTGKLAIDDEYFVELDRNGSPKGHPRIEADSGKLVVRQKTRSGRPRLEDLGLNHTAASDLQLSGDKYPDFDALRAEMARWRTYFLDPAVAMRSDQPPREVDDIGVHGQSLAPLLYRLKEPGPTGPRPDETEAAARERTRAFRAVARGLKTAIPTVDDLDVVLDERRGTLEIWLTQNGTPFSSRVISEGTLRVLALCAIAATPWPPSLIAFEEPENGVHPRRIEVVARLLASMASSRRSQVIISSHSPVLVAAIAGIQREQPGLAKLLRCRQQGNRTELEVFDPAGPLFEDEEIRQALKGSDDEQLIDEMLKRGWLDG